MMEEVEDKEQSSDSESSSLKIAEENEVTPKKKKQSQFDSRDLDKTIEETIEKCENFTPEVAKKMLLKLIKNEHILALSLLKAEEQEFKDKRKESESDDDDKKSENEAPATPKLTRLKAKQLNQTLPIPGSLKSTEPCKDVVALINDEMKSDDEDDEYHPGDSDDDANNQTFSDIESQPSTPGSALFQSEQDIDSPVKDGDFKLPRSLSTEEQENISRRTRSKLCLSTTPIETIESAFIPPDITTDMYDFYHDHEVDNDWMGFLSEFLMPLNNAEEDDEKSDPEYVVAESVPVDKEELRPVRVSKKELNQLISELLEDTSLNFDSEPSTSYKRSSNESQLNKIKRQRSSSPNRAKTQSPKISSKFYSQDLNTPIREEPPIAMTPEPTTPINKRHGIDKVQTSLDISEHDFYQQQILTPQRMGFTTPTIMQSPVIVSSPLSVSYPPDFLATPEIVTVPPIISSPVDSRIPQITGVYGSAVPDQQPSAPQVLVVNSQNQLEIQSSSNLMSQAFCKNGVMQLPQFQSIIVQVPTIDLLQNRINLSAIIAPPPVETQLEIERPVTPLENLTDDKKTQINYRSDKLNEFTFLETELPPEEKTFENQPSGFTLQQRNLYEQQMRVHAQLLAQHFVQVYANPKWWEKAEPIKKNLLEIQTEVKPDYSPDTSKHIKECLKMCTDWESGLQENNDRNKKYAEYLYKEHDLDVAAAEDSKGFKGWFHPRLMEHLLSSKAIIYTPLLPKVPFRAVTVSKVDPPNSELRLIAFGLERFHNEQLEKLNCLNPYRLREPKIGSLSRDVMRHLQSFRSAKRMTKIIENYKNHQKMNPIKYFFKHKRAPPIDYKIEEIDLDFIVPPKNLRRGLLPKTWDAYMFSQERLNIHPYHLAVKESPIVQEISEVAEEEPTLILPEANEKSINNQYKIEILYDDIPQINICVVPKTPEKPPEVNIACINLNTPNKAKGEKSTEEKQKNLISILKKVTDSLEKSPKQRKSVNFLLPPISSANRCSPRFEKSKSTQEISNFFLLSQKFFIVIESFFSNYIKNLRFRNECSPLLIRFFHRAKSIDIYLQLVKESIMLSKKRQNEAEAAPKQKKNVSSSEEYSKRLHRKLAENRNLIMESERNKCTIEKDCSYAYNYLERVKKTLSENGDDELYREVMSMLTSFDPDYESVPELYHKIESLLLPNYADLVDLFLTFLLPEHAAEIGKFFEHFCLSNMTNLLKKLNFYFSKQPSHMKKVYSVLNELSNEDDLTMDRLKAKILPLLKGNQLLIDWFLELFGNPMESLPSEFENVYIKKSLSDSDNSIDNYEEIYSKDLIECKNIDDLNSCGVKYKNGKLMYHGTLLPAKISFLAHDSPSPTTEIKSEENSFCLHEIRKHVKFNDPKKPEVEEDKEPAEDKKKTKSKKPKLCDAQTLHAHAVRLNSIHAQHGEKISDLVHLLIPTQQHSGAGSDERNSPKKTRSVKKASNSPKKTTNKSPNSSGNSTNVAPLNNSPSKALQTAKKLRNLIEDDNDERISKKRRKPADSSEPAPNKVKKTKTCSKKPVAEVKSMQPSSSKDLGDGQEWTREEDKIILEEINVGYESNEKLLDILVQKLTTRLREAINKRRLFLLEVVSNHSKFAK